MIWAGDCDDLKCIDGNGTKGTADCKSASVSWNSTKEELYYILIKEGQEGDNRTGGEFGLIIRKENM